MKETKFTEEEIRLLLTYLWNYRRTILDSPFVSKRGYIKKLDKIIDKVSILNEKKTITTKSSDTIICIN